mgnify:CR=1 FL=1
MSVQDSSSFIMKQGLESFEGPSIYVSFVLSSQSDLYLRHLAGRIVLSRTDQSILFRQDATFQLISSNETDLVVLQAINLASNNFVALDQEANSSLVIESHLRHIKIKELEERFFFRIINRT